MRSKTPAYDLETLLRAASSGTALEVDGGTAAVAGDWMARAEPSLRYGVQGRSAWYVRWAAAQLATYQRCFETTKESLLGDALRMVHIASDGHDPQQELVYLRATRAEFDSVVARPFYEALVADGDHVVVIWSGLHREVLVVRRDVVMAAAADRAPHAERNPPDFGYKDGEASTHLPDASHFRERGGQS